MSAPEVRAVMTCDVCGHLAVVIWGQLLYCALCALDEMRERKQG